MPRKPGFIAELVQKYTPEIVHGIEGQVRYKDAWLEPSAIIIPTGEIAETLDGWHAYRVPVDKKGRAGKIADTIIGEPTVYDVVQWAKRQDADDLRHLLGLHKIKATGNVTYILAYRLSYLYEAKQLERQNKPIPDASIRQRHIKALDTLLHVKGVSNEQAIVLVRQAIQTGIMPKPEEIRRVSDNDKIDPKKIRERLKQADAKAKAEGDTPGEDAGSTPAKGGKTGEREAITSGKGKSKPGSEEKQVEQAKQTKSKQASTSHEEETSDVKTKGKKATKKTAAKKDSDKGHEPKGGLSDAKKDIPIGSVVKYLGTRNKHLKGKQGTVLRYVGPNGVAVKYSDGTIGSVSPTQLEMVKKGTGKVA